MCLVLGKCIDWKVDLWLPRTGGVEGGYGTTGNGYRISFWNEENVIKLIVVMDASFS